MSKSALRHKFVEAPLVSSISVVCGVEVKAHAVLKSVLLDKIQDSVDFREHQLNYLQSGSVYFVTVYCETLAIAIRKKKKKG